MNSQNSLDRYRTVWVNDKGFIVGEDHPRAKYTDADIDAVFELREEGFSLRAIAKKMEMPLRTVRSYLNGSTRQGVSHSKRIKVNK